MYAVTRVPPAQLGELGFSLNPLKAIKSVAKAVGTVAKTAVKVAGKGIQVAAKVAPVAVAFIPGVGIPAAAAITAGLKVVSGVTQKKKIGAIATDAIVGGAEGAAAGVFNKVALKGQGYKTVGSAAGKLLGKKKAPQDPQIAPRAPGGEQIAPRAPQTAVREVGKTKKKINLKRPGTDFSPPPIAINTRPSIVPPAPETLDVQRPAPETVAPQIVAANASTPMLREPETTAYRDSAPAAADNTILGMPPIALLAIGAAVLVPMLSSHDSSGRR